MGVRVAKEIEFWRSIDGFEGKYDVSSFGRVRNVRTGDVLKPYENEKGYLKVGLYKNGKSHKKRVNRLVARAFIDNPYELPDVDHLNGDKQDNRASNLQWTDSKTNNRLRKMRIDITESIPVLMQMFGSIGADGIDRWEKLKESERLELIVRVSKDG